MIDGASYRTVITPDVELAVIEAGAPGPPDDDGGQGRPRPVVVLVHGYPDTKSMWEPVFARLAQRHHVVAYDVRGAGRSSTPRGVGAYRLARLGDDLLAVLDAVAVNRSVHLVGHDWGALQGWAFVSDPRFHGRLASFTAIAGPSLAQVGRSGRQMMSRSPLRALLSARRSWYVVILCLPGGPTLLWRVLLAGDRWSRYLREAEDLDLDHRYPAATVASDGIHGAALYRANIPAALAISRSDPIVQVPVQLIVAASDRYIPDGYYDGLERIAPRLRRRMVAGSHWAPRRHPEVIAGLIAELVDEVEQQESRARERNAGP